MGEGPSQSIDRPDHHHIELSADGPLPQRIEGRPLLPAFRAADSLIDEPFVDLPAVPFGHQPKLTELIVDRLAVCRHPSIDGGSRGPFIFRVEPPFP